MQYGNDQIEELQRRVREAEIIFLEYLRIEHLLDYAAQSHDLLHYEIDHAPFAPPEVGEQGVGRVNLLLYADPVTLRLIDANDAALSFFGLWQSRSVAIVDPRAGDGQRGGAHADRHLCRKHDQRRHLSGHVSPPHGAAKVGSRLQTVVAQG